MKELPPTEFAVLHHPLQPLVQRIQWVAVAPMIFSGYLIRTAVEETWRAVWIVVQITSSLCWLAGDPAHFVSQRPKCSRGHGVTEQTAV